MKRIAIAAAIALWTCAASAQTKLTFGEALTRALDVNNSVGISRAEVGFAEATKSGLLSAVMPRITLNGAFTRNSIQQTFGEGSDGITILPRNDWNYSVVLSQPVFAGARELRAYSQAKIGVENARHGVAGVEDAVLLRVASSYLAVVNADRRVEVERRNIELAERRLKQAQAFYEAGEVTRVDVLRGETAMKAAQRMMSAAQQAREHAVSQLRQDLNLEGAIEVVPPSHPTPALPADEELVRLAESNRADVRVAQNNVRIAGLEVKKQRGFWLPTVTFDGGYVQQKTAFPADNFAYGSLRFNVPVFQSGEVIARVAGAKQREKQAEISLADARLAAREDVLTALADVRSAHTGMQLAQEQVMAAQAEYEQAFELYRAQEATSLDVAVSETSLAEARRSLAEETLNHDVAELRVWFAAGAMKQALGITASPATTTNTTDVRTGSK